MRTMPHKHQTATTAIVEVVYTLVALPNGAARPGQLSAVPEQSAHNNIYIHYLASIV